MMIPVLIVISGLAGIGMTLYQDYFRKKVEDTEPGARRASLLYGVIS